MALNAKNIPGSGSKFTPPPALDPGSYPARVVQILSLGLQKQDPYKGEEKEPRQELMVTYELLDEFLQDEDGNDIEDKPRWISETFPMHNLDADLAKSTKRYLALDPDMEVDGDWAELAGTPCTVVLAQYSSKKNPDIVRNKVVSISSMRAKEANKAPELVNPPKVFDIDEPDMEIFWSLPQWLQDKMKENLEYGGSALEKAVKAGKGKEVDEDEEKPKRRQKAAEKASEASEDESDDEDSEDW